MGHAAGVPLSHVWQTLDVGQQMRCMGSIVRYIAQMAELNFPAYGSLYFSNVSAVDSSQKIRLDDNFCIGPHCGLARIPPDDTARANGKSFQGSPKEHIELLHHAQQVLQKLAADARIKDNASPIMLHPDLHMQNIFVNPDDPTDITALIDWQATSIEPAFEHAAIGLDLDTGLLQSEECKDRRPYLEQAYDAFIKAYVPLLANVRSLDDDLLRLFRYCHRSWADGITVLQDELINISRHWEQLGLSGRCPYIPPTGKKLDEHIKNHQAFLDALELKTGLVEQLQTTNDGWVQRERWEDVKAMHAAAFKIVSDTVSQPDSDTTVEELEAIWPFDKPTGDDKV
ncbi:hypothetical protein H2203_005190 [Taxawa tesnikishii (nom. ined.)]|nr:hypothetical protein H2203_005190 [Dothideales sp. JES 119]